MREYVMRSDDSKKPLHIEVGQHAHALDHMGWHWILTVCPSRHTTLRKLAYHIASPGRQMQVFASRSQ